MAPSQLVSDRNWSCVTACFIGRRSTHILYQPFNVWWHFIGSNTEHRTAYHLKERIYIYIYMYILNKAPSVIICTDTTTHSRLHEHFVFSNIRTMSGFKFQSLLAKLKRLLLYCVRISANCYALMYALKVLQTKLKHYKSYLFVSEQHNSDRKCRKQQIKTMLVLV